MLLSHRVNKHMSKKHASFFFLYNRKPILLIYVKFDFVDVEEKYSNESSDKVTFDAVLSTAISTRENVYQTDGENIRQTQAKQQIDYNRRHQAPKSIMVGQEILSINQKGKTEKVANICSNCWFFHSACYLRIETLLFDKQR